ncbi:MAG TPA: cellulase family glycosylhydrolase [Candidatus Paceibacterota bacterium]|nr:cellulase family glycosylhydrolase [Candidatus Paceibacterota bacterium]
MIIRIATIFCTFGLTGSLYAQTLMSLGATAPTPGVNDISQLSTAGNTTWPDTINYFTDNNPPVGQTFTTGTNALRLTSLAIKTAGLNSGGGYGTPATTPTYYLRIYSISNNTATFLIAFSAANPGFTDGAWLQWSGLNVPLAANRTYAFTFGRQTSGGGWAALAVAANAYAGGEIVTVPINGGAVTTGSSHSYDAVFNLGLQPAPTNPPASMPLPLPTYGWNMGNTLEATWGVPNRSAALFYTAANAGFNAVRIPVSWNFNATTNVSGGVTNYPVNPAFVAQVKQAVDWALDAGMYVMINIHWDGGWMENNITTNIDPVINAKMQSYATQIATAFAGYDNRLLFAAANEPNVNSPEHMKTLMYYYQTYVNAVRAVGGYNTNRWLVMPSVSDPTWMNALPTDTVTNRIMVEYHQYTPSLFTIIHDDPVWGTSRYFWGKAYHYSGDPLRNADFGEEDEIDAYHQQLADLYVNKGIPVLIGEFGAYRTDSLLATNATEAAWNRASTLYWNKYVAESARGHGLSPFYWSTPNQPFHWTSGAVTDAELVTALTGGAVPPPPNGAPYAPSGLTATASAGQVSLSWNAASNAVSYNLYRASQSGGGSSIAPVVTGITNTSYTDTNLTSGLTFYYQVVGVNASGLSGFSPEAKATLPGVNPDSAQFNFETSPQGWYSGGGIISGVTQSTAQHYAGNGALAVNFTGAASGNSSINVGNMSILPGVTVTFRVWIPSGHKISSIQPYMQDKNWAWTSSWYGSFTANAWNTLTLTVPANAVSPFANFGLQFATSAAWTGTCYIDAISWNTPGPDFNLAASPTSLTVNSGTNGTSLITVTATNGLNAVYTLSVSNLPSGVSAAFTNNPNPGGQSLLTLTASNNVVSGTTNITVIATAGLISHTKTIALTLTGPTNTPPTLAAIANQTVNVGQTVAFTANATDTNQPPQTLTFTLLAGATNATLNTNSGAFSFRPLVTQANSTNNFTLKVTDNGTPSLSATQSFAVVVNPLVAPTVNSVSAAGGQFSFSVSGQSGPDYAIETSTNLTQWSTVLITNSPALPFTWTDTNSPEPMRFYRIKLGPPLP